MDCCDLCGATDARLTTTADLWGMGDFTCCVDATACALVWGPALVADTARLDLGTDVLPFRAALADLEGRQLIETRRLPR